MRWLCHRLNSLNDSKQALLNHQGIILHIIIRKPFTNAASIALNASRDTLCSIHAITISGCTYRNGAIKQYFFTRIRSTEGSSVDCSLFILLHALALYLAVKILLPFKSFCMKIWARWLIYICRLYFPSRMPAGPHLLQPILLSENIPNIWHKSSTKHKEVRPDWNDKNDNANYAPSYHMEGLPMVSCHF